MLNKSLSNDMSRSIGENHENNLYVKNFYVTGQISARLL